MSNTTIASNRINSLRNLLFPNGCASLALLTLLCILSCGDPEDFSTECLPPGLRDGVIAYYPFNNGSLLDASPNSNNLQNPTTASPATDRFGNPICAYMFTDDPSGAEYLTTAHSAFLDNLDEFTIALWYMPQDTLRPGGKFEVLFGRGDEGRCPDRRGEWSVGLFDCRKAVFGHNNSVWANSVTPPGNCQGEVIALTGAWHHVVGVKNGENYKIYFDGELNDVASGNAQCSNIHTAEDAGDVFIGTKFTGSIDDIVIYNRELTEAEIATLYQAEMCCE